MSSESGSREDGLGFPPELAAFLWGLLSAVSLPMGAVIALMFKIPKRINSALMAFGGGALLFAVTIELYGHALNEYDEGKFTSKGPMIMLGVGSILGAIIFSVSNYFIENQGGFMRQLALKHRWFIWRRKRARAVMEASNTEDVPITGTTYGATGDKAASSETDPILERPGTLSRSDSFVSDSDSLLDHASIEFPASDHKSIDPHSHEHTEDANVGIAIWLGILIDAVPESLVIGILCAQDAGISITFILGVFLANLPEALSSSVIMKRAGMKSMTIMLMWTSIMIITGAGAALGAVIFAGEDTEGKQMASKTVEGLAAGAMLVVISETVLPEAFRHAGKAVGFSTLLGFLAAYIIKLSEE